MNEVKLELYAPYHGGINPIFQNLPGYTNAQLAANEYWAVCMPQPAMGSPEADWLASIPADANFPLDTLGTETLPPNTNQFIVSHACIAGGKYIPYIFHPVSPGGQLVGPIPEFPIYVTTIYCVSVTPPGPSGIGIWIVTLERYHATQQPVKAPDPRWTVFEPPVNTATVTRPWTQPYLILKGDTGTGLCAELTDLSSNKNCYEPGNQGIFTVSIDDPDASLTAYSWQFKNQDTQQTKQFNTAQNTLQITFDSTWEPGNWCLDVTAVAGNAAPNCAVAINYPPAGEEFCFGLLASPCPKIDSLTWTADTQDPCTIEFTVTLSGDYSGKQLQWNFGDGTPQDIQNVIASTMTNSHSYSPDASGSIYVSVELLGINLSCCPQQIQDDWVQLPPEGCGKPNGPPDEPPKEPPDEPPGEPPDNGGEKSTCGGLVWAAVTALALGILMLALHQCMGAFSGYAFVIGWILVGVYFLLMGIWKILGWLAICNSDRCEAAAIHMAILGPLGALLGLLAWLVPCFWQPVFWVFGPIAGLWGSIAAACLLED